MGLTDTTTPGQSGSGSNNNEGVLHTSQSSEMEPHHQIQFSVLPRTLFFVGVEVLPLCRVYIQCILSTTNRARTGWGRNNRPINNIRLLLMLLHLSHSVYSES